MRRLLVSLLSVLLGLSQVSAAQANPETDPFRGLEEYLRYCSACHGDAAHGQGPVANVLSPRPPPLTTLSTKYGTPLGTKLVAYVMGTTMPRAHGSSEMPVWGRNLADAAGDDSNAVQAIWRILAYLDTIQADSDR